MTHKIRPYGDTLGDGKTQVAFTLPIPCDTIGIEAAKAFAKSIGMHDPMIAYSTSLGDGFSHYIVYGSIYNDVDLETLSITEIKEASMNKDEVEAYIEQHFDGPLVFIGASTGTDAHTVGIDAIMNMKGYHGNYGLERYKGIHAINLGGQVENETLLDEAIKSKADVILISQTVTQKEVHLNNLTAFIELLEAEGKRNDFIVIIGGARINHSLAKELGYDAGFGAQSYAYDVASFAVKALYNKAIKLKK